MSAWYNGRNIQTLDQMFAEQDKKTQQLETEIERLRRFKTAYEEWIEKTEWVQAAITSSELPAKYLGWHRADIMRAEIEQLRAAIATVKEVEFPRKMEAVSNGWRNKLAAAQAEIEQMRDTFAAIKAHCEPQPSPLAQSIALTCSRHLMKPEDAT